MRGKAVWSSLWFPSGRIGPGRPARRSAIVLLSSLTAGLLNFCVHFSVSRRMEPQEYAVFATVLTILLLSTIPSEIILTTVGRHVAQLLARNRAAAVWSFLATVGRSTVVASVSMGGLLVLFGSWVAGYLQLDSVVPIWVVAATLPPGLLLPVCLGALQGAQRFGLFGGGLVLWASSRLLFATLFVLHGWGANGALIGCLLSYVIALAFLGVVVRSLFSGPQETGGPEGMTMRAVLGYSRAVIIGFLCFAVLTNVDVIIVKHYFSPEQAGYYSAAAVIAKSVLYLGWAMAMVVFPEAVARHEMGGGSRELARWGLLVTALVSVLPVVGLALFSTTVVGLLYGTAFSGSVAALTPLAGAMVLFALVQFRLYYHLALSSGKFLIVLGLLTSLQVIALLLYHGSVFRVILVLIGTGTGLLLLSEILVQPLVLGFLTKGY